MNKIKTVIADDDHLVRSYLKMLPSWERAGFEIVADARDGEEAMEALEKTNAVLLVTDISMPLMDGITLIRKIRRTNQKLYIIVLSCHDEFEFVKDAMKEGADEYVLKNTLDEDTLYELLVGTKEKIREKQLKNTSLHENSDMPERNNIVGKYRFFNGVLAGNLKGNMREEARICAGIKGTYQNSAVIALFLEEWEEKEERWTSLEMEQYCQEFLIRLYEGMKNHLGERIDYVETIYLGKGVFCVFLDLSNQCKSSRMYQELTDVASVCYKICQQERYAYGIGVSNVCIGSEAVRQAYQQAREMMKLSFYDDREILYYNADNKTGTRIPPKAEMLISSVDTCFYQNDRAGFLKKCQEVIQEFEKEQTERRLVLQWLVHLERKAGVVREEDVEKIHSIRQLPDILETIAGEIFEVSQDVIPENVSKAVRIAAEYAVKHYREPIGLTDAASAAGVNSAYLSYLFQKEMKTGFSSFLLNRRMECAREMLKKTNLKVREVAQQSGFQDYHYFAKAFKKMHEISPAEYRKQSQEAGYKI